MKTVETVRRERLRELKERFGSVAELNRQLGRLDKDATLGHILNGNIGTKTNKPKTMGSELARDIERKLDLPEGWMDTDPELLLTREGAWPFPGIDRAAFDALTAEQKIEIQGVVRKAIRDFAEEISGGDSPAVAVRG